MFEITGDDIAALNDEDLRALVGLLCEADLRRRSLAVSAVTWGGNQTAADAGLDVRVALPPGTAIDGFIPRAAAGFQVKKPDMPRNAILSEMKPGDVLRPVIKELADVGGAYVIVSSTGSTSDSALRNRRKAMAEAVQDLRNAGALALEFYDRSRLATWVRDHPGLIPWIRERISKAVPGWRGYGAWAFSPEGTEAPYLLDDAARIHTGGSSDGDGLSAADGLNRIREVLHQAGKVVRLVGLSGVGKTRIVQALFDARVGENSLDPSLAVYTNIVDRPEPQPTGLASDLIASRTRAILVIDNCPPDLHQRLSEVVRAQGSTLSLLTVEYDIRDDQPEGTDVFALEPSSTELVAKLVAQRYPDISQVDARTIADFSGGNARVAIALAETIGKNETIAGLSNADLFQRLFQQRHPHDEGVLLIAQASSLVYSFQGEDLSGDDAELPVLGRLIGKTAEEVFRGVAALKRRDLVQQRGVWRAVLPHAIANRLAEMALQNIPYATIEENFIKGDSKRLRRSFSRRLGYLDNSPEARAIVARWLAPGGLLGDVTALNELGRTMFDNVAPVSPRATLDALRRALSGPDAEEAIVNSTSFVLLLRSLAYDADLFDDAAELLLKFAEREKEDDNQARITNIFASLFSIYLSGTHAPIKQRLRMIEALLRSDLPRLRALGVTALRSALETSHFSSGHSFEFGARSRDYGYHPRNRAEQDHWFKSALELAETFALSDLPAVSAVRNVLGEQFRGLWSNAAMLDELERISRAIAAKGLWREGWIATRQTRLYDSKDLSPETVDRLSALEAHLRPKEIVDKVRAIILTSKGGSLDLDDLEEEDEGDYAAESARAEATVRQLGRDTAGDEGAFATLLPELVSGNGKLFLYAHGLALGADDPLAMWDRLVRQIAAIPEAQRNDLVLRGFLNGFHARDAKAADALLDAALEDGMLGVWYPVLQIAVPIGEEAIARLKRSLDIGAAPIGHYRALAWGRASDPIPGPQFKELILAIAQKPSGFEIAAEILSMRIHSDRSDKHPSAPETIETGRALLGRLELSQKNDREDYQYGVIVRACLGGAEGADVARGICRKLKASIAARQTYAFSHDDLVRGLAAVQPDVVLDELFGGDEKERKATAQLIEDLRRHRKNPLDAIFDETFIAWCDRDPATRYPVAASIVTTFRRAEDKADEAICG